MPERFDAWILDSFERFSHRFQRMFGQDCFWLTRACIVLLGVCWVGGLWLSPVVEMPTKILGTALCFYVCSIFRSDCAKAERITLDAQKSGAMNPLRIVDFTRRAIAFIVALMIVYLIGYEIGVTIPKMAGAVRPLHLVSEVINLLVAVVYVMVHYFMACTPLPPVKSKVREWLESFSLMPAPARVPTR